MLKERSTNAYALIFKDDIFQFLYKSFPLSRYKYTEKRHIDDIYIHPDISIQNIIIH